MSEVSPYRQNRTGLANLTPRLSHAVDTRRKSLSTPNTDSSHIILIEATPTATTMQVLSASQQRHADICRFLQQSSTTEALLCSSCTSPLDPPPFLMPPDPPGPRIKRCPKKQRVRSVRTRKLMFVLPLQ